MKLIREILYKVDINRVFGNTSLSIEKVEFDSRLVTSSDMYVAINGVNVNGHDYISQAIENGAKCIICEEMPEDKIDDIVYINVPCSREALAIICSNYFDNPSSKLNLVGVTGTNGKTTITTLLFELYKNLGIKSGLISTVKIVIDKDEYEANQTTPDSLSINRYLNEMVLKNVRYCFMEVSSHGIDQKRITGLAFAGAVFSNLTHDHLDYHASFKHYRDTKKKLFDSINKNGFALTNIDDKNGRLMLQNCRAKKQTYAMHQYAEFKVKVCLLMHWNRYMQRLVVFFFGLSLVCVQAGDVPSSVMFWRYSVSGSCQEQGMAKFNFPAQIVLQERSRGARYGGESGASKLEMSRVGLGQRNTWRSSFATSTAWVARRR